MIFTEQKIINKELKEETWAYETEDIFGKIRILSPVKLEETIEPVEGKKAEDIKKSILDKLVVVTLQSKKRELIINNNIKIIYEPNNEWNEDENNEGESR